MIKFFKTLYRVVKSYDADMEAISVVLEKHSKELVRLDKEQTANIHMRDAQARWLEKKIQEATAYVRERTEVHADVSASNKWRGSNTIIVAGRYKDNDYVEVFSIATDNFRDVVETLKERSKYGELHTLDAAPHIRELIKRDIEDGN
jgi:hypothetical protein